MVSLKVIGLGVVISYGIALLMKVTMACIQAINKKNEKTEAGKK